MIAFGVWWIAFPVSVVRFYQWFHGGAVKVPSPRIVRVLGGAWLLLVGIVFWVAR
jgi:hypothetical protein